MKRMLGLLPWLLLGGCTSLEPDILGRAVSDAAVGTDSGAVADTVVAATFNMSIGYEVASLIASDLTNDTVAWTQAMRILDQYTASRPLERVRAAAEGILRECPDLVGLQETQNLRAWGVRDDVPVVDFVDSLLSWMRRHPGDCPRRYAVLRSPLNVTQRSLSRSDRPEVGTLHLHFEEGNALLYDSIQWRFTDSATFLYTDLLRTELLGQLMSSQRALQSVRMTHTRNDGKSFPYQIWNSHLEVLSVTRKNQAAEMRIMMSNLFDWSSTPGQIVFADLNDSLGSSTLNQFISKGWNDAWLLDPNRGEGLTCCASNGWLNRITHATGDKSRRIDYILTQGADSSFSSRIALDSFVTTPDGDSVFVSDHAMVVAKLRFRVRN